MSNDRFSPAETFLVQDRFERTARAIRIGICPTHTLAEIAAGAAPGFQRIYMIIEQPYAGQAGPFIEVRGRVNE